MQFSELYSEVSRRLHSKVSVIMAIASCMLISQSRLGVSDLGVNKARVESFAEHMANVEMATSECV